MRNTLLTKGRWAALLTVVMVVTVVCYYTTDPLTRFANVITGRFLRPPLERSYSVHAAETIDDFGIETGYCDNRNDAALLTVDGEHARALYASAESMRRLYQLVNRTFFPVGGVTNPGFTLSPMFASPLWIAETRIYLVVVRLNVMNASHKESFSVLCASVFDENWHEVALAGKLFPAILPIPLYREGHEDPRVFRDPLGHICVVYNAQPHSRRRIGRRMFVYNFHTGKSVQLKVAGVVFSDTQKNWAPLVVAGQQYFVTNQMGPVIVQCTHSPVWTGQCRVVDEATMNPLEQSRQLRAGSPYYQLEGEEDYHYSVNYFHAVPRGPYRTMFSVLYIPRGNPAAAEIVCYSKFFRITEPEAKYQIGMGIGRWVTDNTVEVSMTFDDRQTIIIRVSGAMSWIRKAISAHKKIKET